MLPPWEYEFDSAQGLVDLSWTQLVPRIQQDDIDKNPLYNQYPYQEVDNSAAPTSTRHLYHHPEASYAMHTEKPSASLQSIHTDMDAAMEFDNLNVALQIW